MLIGGAETVWGVVALARPAPAARRALTVSAALVAGLVVLLLLPEAAHHGGAHAAPPLPLAAMSGAGALDLAVAVLLAVRLRRGRERGEPGPARFLLGASVAAVVVGIVTTTSLAGTAVGASHVH